LDVRTIIGYFIDYP